MRLPARAARQLPDQSTTLRVESSSTDDPRLRGALPNSDIMGGLRWHFCQEAIPPTAPLQVAAPLALRRLNSPTTHLWNPGIDHDMEQILMAARTALTGRVKHGKMLPPERTRPRVMFFSRRSPSTKPRMSGAIGNLSPRRMKPKKPKNSIT